MNAIVAALNELRAAHEIIGNALRLMSMEQRTAWARLNDEAGLLEAGTTRANEREAAIAALSALVTPSEPMEGVAVFVAHSVSPPNITLVMEGVESLSVDQFVCGLPSLLQTLAHEHGRLLGALEIRSRRAAQ